MSDLILYPYITALYYSTTWSGMIPAERVTIFKFHNIDKFTTFPAY